MIRRLKERTGFARGRVTLVAPRCLCAACALLMVGLAALSAWAGEQLTRLDGTVVSGVVQSISAAGNIQGQDLPANLTLDDLQVLLRAGNAPQAAGKASCVVELAGGAKLPAQTVTLAHEKVEVVTLAAEVRFSLPLEGVRAVVFGNGDYPPEVAKALAEPNKQQDRVFVTVEQQVQSLAGLVEALSADKLDLVWEKQPRSLGRAGLLAIVFAGGKPEPAHYMVQLGAAGSVPASAVVLAGETLTASLVGGGKIDLPWGQVSRIDVRSARLTYLSDLEPTDVQQESLVAPSRPWQRDKSVLGRPLTLGQETFAKGLGTQSRTRLTFATDEKYRTFAATIGIDAETQGRGDCEFVVLADGQELLRRRMRGGEAPHTLSLDIAGRRRVTLLVEPGEDLDLADHADWAQARLVK